MSLSLSDLHCIFSSSAGIILNYIFARVAKNTLKILWKRTIEEMDGVSKEALNRSTIEFLNLLLGTLIAYCTRSQLMD